MWKSGFFVLLLCAFSTPAVAMDHNTPVIPEVWPIHQQTRTPDPELIAYLTHSLELPQTKENTRLVAIALTLALGPFGAHRIYLGTNVKVPLFYTLTLGGGLGILPVLDLLHIIFTKDLSPYFNNDKIFMWGQKKEAKASSQGDGISP